MPNTLVLAGSISGQVDGPPRATATLRGEVEMVAIEHEAVEGPVIEWVATQAKRGSAADHVGARQMAAGD